MIGKKQNGLGGGNKRRSRLSSRKFLILTTILTLTTAIATPLTAQAIQNIFTNFGTITDIQFQGENIDQVVYQGTVLWERQPPELTDGTIMQTITSANCPATRIRARDARDNRSYYVQKLPDGKCWMLTNLAYIGNGSASYGDTTALTAINSGHTSFPNVKQVVIGVTGSDPASGYTDEPTNPNTTTGVGGQYGYLYNWCAALGGQAAACQDSTASQPNQGINNGMGANNNPNICPKGWRLPTGGSNGEFQALADALGATNDAAGSTILRNAWLGVYSGGYQSGFDGQGGYGGYWSSTIYSASDAHISTVSSGGVSPVYNFAKPAAFAVRCVAP